MTWYSVDLQDIAKRLKTFQKNVEIRIVLAEKTISYRPDIQHQVVGELHQLLLLSGESFLNY